MSAAEPACEAGLGEFDRIARYFRPLAAGCPGALALTDDAAVLEVPAGSALVVTTDAMVAGVHFLPGDSAGDIAAKLLRTNLSDLAAMGAAPFGYSLALALPAAWGEAWLAGFSAGLSADQQQYGITLIGGDSVKTPGPATLAISALGLVPRGTALTRRVDPACGALSEQRVFVSGTIGDAALGLKLVFGELSAPPDDVAWLVQRLHRPEPRLTLGQGLRGLASAAADVSDGLVADLGHIAEVTGCAARIEADRVPLSAPARALIGCDADRLAAALTGGDDYELVFTVPEARRSALVALAARVGVAVTEIGTLEPGPAGQVVVVDRAGIPLALPNRGWNHFPDRPTGG